MDFTVSDKLAAHRDEAQAWVAANVRPEWVDEQHHSGLYQTMELHHLLARDGLLGAGWPAECGGSDVDPDYAMAVFQAIGEMGFHSDGWGTTSMVARTIAGVGTDEQKKEYVAGALRGEVMIALGYSEPESGSDVAAAKTTCGARRRRVDHQRPEDVHEHRPGRHPRVRACSDRSQRAEAPGPDAVHGADEQRRLRVPAHAHARRSDHDHHVLQRRAHSRLGAHRRGERRLGRDGPGAGLRARGGGHHLVRGRRGRGSRRVGMRNSTIDGRPAIDDTAVAARIGRIWIDEEIGRLLGHWANWNAEQGRMSTAYGAVRKLISGEASLRNTGLALDVLGPAGVLAEGDDDVPARGMFEHEYRYSQVRTIYGGSSEIMRDIIAQKHLGLPRNRPSN